eukprot:697185-Rhodomonas_salina.1
MMLSSSRERTRASSAGSWREREAAGSQASGALSAICTTHSDTSASRTPCAAASCAVPDTSTRTAALDTARSLPRATPTLSTLPACSSARRGCRLLLPATAR